MRQLVWQKSEEKKMKQSYTRIANGKLKRFRWQLFSYDRENNKNEYIEIWAFAIFISVERGI